MPDADRSDLELITQGLGGLTLNIGDMSDPFEALSKLGGFSGGTATVISLADLQNKQIKRKNLATLICLLMRRNTMTIMPLLLDEVYIE